MQGIQGITGIRGIGYRRRRRGGVTPGPSWPSAPVAGLHVYSEAGPAWCRQFADGTGSVVANDPVGYLHNAGDLETPFTQETTGARPLIEWDEEREAWYLQFDGVDDWIGINLASYTDYELMILATKPSVVRTGMVNLRTDDARAGVVRSINSQRILLYDKDDNTGGNFLEYEGSLQGVAYAWRVRVSDSGNDCILGTQDGLQTGVITTVASKDMLGLGYMNSDFTYSDIRCYAIAATIGSVMSTEQVNALKADWSAKFGVEFAW